MWASDPADPADTTLDPRTGWGTGVLWMAALLLIAMTIAVVVLGLR